MAEKVRLQIRVDQGLVDTIDDLAKRMNRSLSWLAAELLADGVQARERVLFWMMWRMMQAGLVQPVAKIMDFFPGSKRRKRSGEETYLQCLVSPELADKLEEVGEANERSRAEMAAAILEYAVETESWAINAATSKPFEPHISC